MILLIKKIKLLVTAVILLSTINYSQKIIFRISNTSSTSAVLFSHHGEKLAFVDSVFTIDPEWFLYENEELHNGFYRFSLDKQKSITFLNDGNNVEINVDAENISETIEVVESESNKLFYEFIQLNRDYKTKTELLQLILSRYPSNDEYYKLTKQKLIELQNNYLEFVNETSQQQPESFIARYIKASQLPVIPPELHFDEQLAHLKNHSLDSVDFTDDELIYSDCFTNKSIEYLTYYRNPQLPMGLLEQEFQKAVDTLLIKSSVNIFVYQHIADYLIDGFKQFGFDNVVDYIVENYVVKDDLCLDEQTENSIQNRINQSKLLTIGSKTSNIILPDNNDEEFNLEKLTAEKALLIFYASWCPHCQDLLPEIHSLYKQRNDFEVVAISLDEKKADWISFITDNKLDWINVTDLKGWDSKVAQEYYIYATPTMFLIDGKMKIIGKPITLNDLINQLSANP